MHSYTTFLCTKFQSIWTTCFHFTITLTPLQKEIKMKKLSQFLKVHISKTPGAIYLWGTDSGGRLHSKNHPVSYKQHEVT